MQLLKSLIILIIGFVLLIKGADFFVEGSSAVAKRLRIPSMIIGMTIVAMGTSLPECAVSVTASLTGNNSLAISNAVGSNIFNLLVVCGVCSLFVPLAVQKSTLQKEFPLSIFCAGLLLLLGYLGMTLGRIDGILFLIILYVIAELWKKDPDDDEYEDLQGDTRHVKSSRELKAEEKARAKRMKQEDKELLQDAKEKKKKSKKEEKKKKKIRTGGFVDEIDEDDLDDEPEETVRPVGNVQAATSEAHELLKKEIAAATAEEEAEVPESYSEVSGESAEPSVSEEEFPEEDIEEEQPVEIKKLAIPRRTASQFANRARKEGDAPDVVRDSITKVTLFDYSDIIGGNAEEEEE